MATGTNDERYMKGESIVVALDLGTTNIKYCHVSFIADVPTVLQVQSASLI